MTLRQFCRITGVPVALLVLSVLTTKLRLVGKAGATRRGGKVKAGAVGSPAHGETTHQPRVCLCRGRPGVAACAAHRRFHLHWLYSRNPPPVGGPCQRPSHSALMPDRQPRGLESIDEWLGGEHWDVIHFNWGLHDLKRMKDGKMDVSADNQVPPEQYRTNLDRLVVTLEATGAKLVWANTTPVPEGAAGRIPGDDVQYNAIAAEVMQKHGVVTNDLYAAVLPHLDPCQQPANVHFTSEGSAFLASHAANAILDALGIVRETAASARARRESRIQASSGERRQAGNVVAPPLPSGRLQRSRFPVVHRLFLRRRLAERLPEPVLQPVPTTSRRVAWLPSAPSTGRRKATVRRPGSAWKTASPPCVTSASTPPSWASDPRPHRRERRFGRAGTLRRPRPPCKPSMRRATISTCRAVPTRSCCSTPSSTTVPKATDTTGWQDFFPAISPLHNIREGLPPTLVLLGDHDKLIPREHGLQVQETHGGMRQPLRGGHLSPANSTASSTGAGPRRKAKQPSSIPSARPTASSPRLDFSPARPPSKCGRTA